MWWNQGKRIRPKYEFKSRTHYLLNRKFQLKHCFILLGTMVLPLALLVSLSLYFINENFGVFLDLSYRYAPEMIEHLEREQFWLNSLFGFFVLGSFIFVFMVGLKLTYHLIGPIYAMEKHINQLSKGDFSQAELRTRKGDDYQELVDSYNYFYKSLQRHLSWELKELKSLKISPYAPESLERWETLIKHKAEQIKEPATDSFFEPELKELNIS